jgi:hypothetical protein
MALQAVAVARHAGAAEVASDQPALRQGERQAVGALSPVASGAPCVDFSSIMLRTKATHRAAINVRRIIPTPKRLQH